MVFLYEKGISYHLVYKIRRRSKELSFYGVNSLSLPEEWQVENLTKKPKFTLNFQAYPIGEPETAIANRIKDLEMETLKKTAKVLLDRAIQKQAYEIIIDIYEQTEGAN